MTHDELRDYIDKFDAAGMVNEPPISALRAVVELHRPEEIKLLSGEVADTYCFECEGLSAYPCPTIQAIEKELG
jgi:hypothetical protein